MAQQITIRALAIRANFALARSVFKATGDEEAGFDLALSVEEALWLGFNERFSRRQASVPVMFADEPVLRDAWLDGHDRAVAALLDLEDSPYPYDDEDAAQNQADFEEASVC